MHIQRGKLIFFSDVSLETTRQTVTDVFTVSIAWFQTVKV